MAHDRRYDSQGPAFVDRWRRRLLPTLRAVGLALRTGWLVVGVTLLLLMALELTYRGQATLRRTLRGEPPVVANQATHPYADSAWWRQWWDDDVYALLRTRYDPFRGWWPLPVEHLFVHVDSAGRRRTIPSPNPVGRVVYLLGGSTMWGYTARDEFTIPSLVAEELQSSHPDVAVINLAQPAFTATQEVATLMLELRGGRVPEAVVLLDGNNEVATAFQSGMAGHVLNERAFAERMEQSVGLRHALRDVSSALALVQRLRAVVMSEESASQPMPDRICSEIAGQYAQLARVLDALAREFGFAVVLVSQPLRATTRKPLSAWERTLSAPPGWVATQRKCAALVDSTMASRLGHTYFSLSALFDDEVETVFIDEYGHITEAANRRVADTIAAVLLRKLGAQPH